MLFNFITQPEPRVFRNYRPEVRDLCERLQNAGFQLSSCDDGEEVIMFSGNLDGFVEDLTACDDTTLRVKCCDAKQRAGRSRRA